MKSALTAVVVLLLAACETPPLELAQTESALRLGAAIQPFSYTTIEVPGALGTQAWGINARGDIVGAYVDADFAFHGFLLRKGVFTTIDVPGAAGTAARGISPDGDIVGDYWLPGEPGVANHGYLLTRAGEFVQVDYPGHLHTIPQRILPDGTILGCRHDMDLMDSMRGVSIGGDGTTSEIDAHASMNNGATPDLRRIAGLWTNMETGQTQGYIIDDGVFTPFMVPGSIMTAAWDVNPRGEVAGVFRDGAGFHGFVLSGDEFTTVHVPGSAATRAFGINAGGDVVGAYVMGGKTYGFLASATRQHRQ